MTLRKQPVSIVCVFNDPAVMRDTLQRSIDALRHEAPDVEFLPIDNTSRQFPTAGAALNHGASLARHEFVAFCHQDVYLHSLAALEHSAGLLADHSDIGMLGAVGIASDGQILGRVRDRVVLLGEPLTAPTDVDSLDEVIFMVPRALIASMPLADGPDLAWHAYAVEYGLRLRARGLRVTAGDIPLTHNSLTTNLDRLDVAHHTVGEMYPEMLPVRTTCGIIRPARREVPGAALVRPHRWRYTWLRESVRTRSARREVAGAPFVLADIRLDIDDILAKVEPLTVINHAGDLAFADEPAGPTELTRIGRHLSVRSVRTAALLDTVTARTDHESMLVTNLDTETIHMIASTFPARDRLVGFHDQLWALLGPAAETAPQQWHTRRARPLGTTELLN